MRPTNSFACLQEIGLVFSVKQSGKIDVGLKIHFESWRLLVKVRTFIRMEKADQLAESVFG